MLQQILKPAIVPSTRVRDNYVLWYAYAYVLLGTLIEKEVRYNSTIDARDTRTAAFDHATGAAKQDSLPLAITSHDLCYQLHESETSSAYYSTWSIATAN